MNTTSLQKAPESKPTSVKGWLQSSQFKEQVALVASKYITPDRFVRVALTALIKNPKLQLCTPESVLKCCMDVAQMGIEPDGRNSHLIPYGNQCTLIVDWKGYVLAAARNGIRVTPKEVREKDKFSVAEDDGTGQTKVVHEVNYTKPRGDIVCFYSRAKYEDGTVDYEVMSRQEVDYVRDTFSRGKEADAWKKSYGEMGKKTVLRRHSKRWNLDVDLEAEPIVTADPPKEEPKGPSFGAPSAIAPPDVEPPIEIEVEPQEPEVPPQEPQPEPQEQQELPQEPPKPKAATGNVLDLAQLQTKLEEAGISPEAMVKLVNDKKIASVESLEQLPTRIIAKILKAFNVLVKELKQ